MILVTGATGIVGRAVVTRLHERGIPFVGVARTGADGLVACELTSGALTDVVQAPPAAIIHTAAAVPHSPQYPDTDDSAELTRRMDANVLQAARQWGCPVVYVSTCGLYDRRVGAVKHEDDALTAPTSPYFAVKRQGEMLFLQSSGNTVLRISAPLGAGVPSHLVASRFILQAMRGGAMRIIGSGSREQNYVASGDIADALVRVAATSCHGVFNIAARDPVTMLELARRVAATIGGSVEMGDESDPREGETARYSIARAVSMLDWAPVTTLEDMIRTVAKSFETQGAESNAL